MKKTFAVTFKVVVEASTKKNLGDAIVAIKKGHFWFSGSSYGIDGNFKVDRADEPAEVKEV